VSGAATSCGKPDATRREIDEMLGKTTYMGGGSSRMCAATVIDVFDWFKRAAVARIA
jgi:hypothetical protein